jgi:hypothetical protein
MGIQGSSNFVQGPWDQVHNHTHGVSTRARFGLTSQNSSKICGHLSDVLSQGLTCYTDVESNGRDAHTKPKPAANVRPTGKRRMRADDLSSPHAPCRQHGLIHPYRLDNWHQDRRTYNARRRTVHDPTPVSTCVQDSVFNKPKSQNLRPPRCSFLGDLLY